MMSEVAQPGHNRVSLTQIIDLGIQKTYHDLTVLAELLPRKTDFERKIEIVNFAERTRQLFIRLLALVKWAGGASKIEQCMDIVSFLDKQALLFINTADNMANIARTTLVQARLPSFQLPCAVEVLTLGTYSRMPTCVRDKIVPSDPITLEEKRSTLARLNHIIEQRLSISSIHPSMRNLKIEYGRVTFHVENEFDLKLTLMGDSPTLPWHVLGLDLLVEDVDSGEGKDLVHPSQVMAMVAIIQQKMNESSTPLVDVFAKLHNFCLSLQIEVLHDQIERLMRERLSNYIKIKEHVPGQELAITYWGGKNSLKIQTDSSDMTKPLKLTHQPELVLESGQAEQDKETIFRPGHVSIEQVITDAIQKRAIITLTQLANELKEKKYGKCTISGVPSLLHVCCLDPCAPPEELIISIDLNGSYLAHVPQYERNCPLADNIQESLNSNRSKLGTYFDQLKIWLTKKRCVRTIDYLSVTASDSLPLCSKANHAKLDDKVPRLFFQFNKYNHHYLMAEFFTSDSHPCAVDTRYSLVVTETAPSMIGDGLDIVETDTSIESVRRDLVVVVNILRLDVKAIIASNYCYEAATQDKLVGFMNNNLSAKKEAAMRVIEGSEKESDQRGISSHLGSRPPVSLVNELPQLVSFCEERLAYLALEKEFRNKNFSFELSHTETSGSAYSITFLEVPSSKSSGYSNALLKDTSVMTVCLHEKPQSSKIWHCSYIFKNCPITTQSVKEQSPRRFVFTPYESPLLNQTMVSKFIEDSQLDWACMAHLYDVVKEFSCDIQKDPKILDSIVLKSFNYKKFVIVYGPQRNFSVTLIWKPTDKKFHLIFSVIGGKPFNMNPHGCMATNYKHEFNQHKSIKCLVNTLITTLEPMAILHELPVYSVFTVVASYPRSPTNSFSLIPLSTTRVKLVYRNCFCIDIKIQQDGSLVVRDGSFSRFNRDKIVEEMTPICNFEALLFRNHVATSYILSLNEFKQIFTVSHIEQHMGMSFMAKIIRARLTDSKNLLNGRALPPLGDPTNICYASDSIQFRFTTDPKRKVIQLKATHLVNDDFWRFEDLQDLERYFDLRCASYPHKTEVFTSFSRLLFSFSRMVMKDMIQILRMEMYPDMVDASIQWRVYICLIVSQGTPFFQTNGIAGLLPLSRIIVFILRLYKKDNCHPSALSIDVPISYDPTTNSIYGFVPPKLQSIAQPHMAAIDNQLKQFSEQFRANNNPGCVIYPAVRHLLSLPPHMLDLQGY